MDLMQLMKDVNAYYGKYAQNSTKGATMFTIHKDKVSLTANFLIDQCHGLAKSCGWWTDLQTGEHQPKRNVGELLMLVVSELAEGMEGNRKNLMDDKLPHRPMLEVELADAVIRIFDMAGGLQLDVAGAIAEKLLYNADRADHKLENRKLADGKKY